MFDIDSVVCWPCFEAVPFDPDATGEFVGRTATTTNAPRKTCR
jgi:hypothetical protein